jgi:hypothetical protein
LYWRYYNESGEHQHLKINTPFLERSKAVSYIYVLCASNSNNYNVEFLETK